MPEGMVYISWAPRDDGAYDVRVGERRWVIGFVEVDGGWDVRLNGRRVGHDPWPSCADARREVDAALGRWAERSGEPGVIVGRETRNL